VTSLSRADAQPVSGETSPGIPPLFLYRNANSPSGCCEAEVAIGATVLGQTTSSHASCFKKSLAWRLTCTPRKFDASERTCEVLDFSMSTVSSERERTTRKECSPGVTGHSKRKVSPICEASNGVESSSSSPAKMETFSSATPETMSMCSEVLDSGATANFAPAVTDCAGKVADGLGEETPVVGAPEAE